jgi:hypothetical protein
MFNMTLVIDNTAMQSFSILKVLILIPLGTTIVTIRQLSANITQKDTRINDATAIFSILLSKKEEKINTPCNSSR